MPVTALKVGEQRIKFLTLGSDVVKSNDGTKEKAFLTVDLRICDKDFVPLIKGHTSIHDEDEETYHRKLRVAATEKGHFVPEESTDPEWNPGYEEPLEEISNGDTV